MSSSFLKKSLELVDSDFVVKHTGKEDSFSQIKLIHKKKKPKDFRGTADIKKKHIKTIEKIRREYKKSTNKQLVKQKVDILHRPVNDKILNKIFQYIHAPGLERKEKEKEEEKTAFTEEDFAKFEREYFAD